MNKKWECVRGKWKKTRGHLDETGKSLYDTVESDLMTASCRNSSLSYQLLYSARVSHHISGANETQQRSMEAFYPFLCGVFFFEKQFL